MAKINLLNSEMRAVMYHYVRPVSEQLPYFQGLPVESFNKQLTLFSKCGPILSTAKIKEAVTNGIPKSGTILTFDDGIKDHFEYVLPALKTHKVQGIFYVPTGPLMKNKILDVHRVHLLLGLHGGEKILKALSPKIEQSMLVDEGVEAFQKLTYAREKLDDSTKSVKRIFNYFLAYEFREPILDELCNELLPTALHDPRSFYMTEKEIKTLHEAGMLVGSHGINHYVMSRVSAEVQREEISQSFAFLESIVGALDIRTFCFPYGGYHSFTPETVEILEDERCVFSFNVEQKPITGEFLLKHPNVLPRFDCNQFDDGDVASFKSN